MNIVLGSRNDMSLGERVWNQHVRQMMPEYVRVIGRVIGRVFIRDINKEVSYNQVVDISVADARRSENLTQAIADKWVDVVYGAEFLQNKQQYDSVKVNQPIQVETQAPVVQQVVQQQQVNTDDLKDFATKIAESAAQSAANKSVESIRDMLGDMSKKINSGSNMDANQVVDELMKRLPQGQAVQQKDSKIDDTAEKVFINLDEDHVLESNIQGSNLGELTIKKDTKTKFAIKKLKNIKKEPANGNEKSQEVAQIQS